MISTSDVSTDRIPSAGFRRKMTVEIVSDIGKKYRVRARPGYRPRGGF